MNVAEEAHFTSMENQIELRGLGQTLAEGSDFLTGEIRRYVQFGDPVHLKNFWNEVRVTRSRDKAVERLKKLNVLPEELAIIKKAKSFSDNLINTEEAAMDAVKKNDFEQARKLVFGKYYEDQKRLIMGNIKKFQRKTNARAEEISNHFREDVSFYMVLTNCLLLVSVTLVLFLVYNIGIKRIINPLRKLSHSMRELAGGNLKIETPVSSRGDEISDIESALRVFRDTAEKRKQVEDELREERAFSELIRVVAMAANKLNGFEEVARISLDMVCKTAGWPVGHVYVVEGSSSKLVSSKIWHVTDNERFAEFRRVTEETVFVPGVGLPGRVFEEKRAMWVADVSKDFNFPRAKLAGEIGVRAGFAFPVMIGDKVVAVAEFFTSHVETLHAELLQAMSSVGIEMGRVFERQQAAETLQDHLNNLEVLIKERTKELVQKNQELTDFASIASHDLSEPLRKVITFGDCLGGRLKGDDEKGWDYLNRMQAAAMRMQELINNLLDYSMVNTQKNLLKEIDFNVIVRQSLLNLESRLSETRGTVQAENLPRIEADPLHMLQLFQNLIANALKYHKKGIAPVVKISSQLDGDDRVNILVSDNGIGFDEKYSQRIFRPFQRLHSRTEFKGTGMGLAICKKIVDRHNGVIEIKSVPNEGSTFVVNLPLSQNKNRSDGAHLDPDETFQDYREK
ncbi:MAG: GAF domain-containing protein [Candidatus Nitronauta litoralis]|uniref:histidine kinase n=1 Tax=Candidatus Nitronauta litoralis TaxID=2705533 RepID=A0A7T0FYZ9_9BACT|nr:MAG: GAF domain-containing protein [Candidatus Nitronauta litoralis]